MNTTLALSPARARRLKAAARRAGFRVSRGPKSQLGDFVEFLLVEHEQRAAIQAAQEQSQKETKP